MTVNYHTHTVRCRHASGSEREYIETAISRGLTILGFSDHSPYVFEGDYYSGFRMRPEELGDYCETLAALREEYRGKIDIKIGLEAEYYPKFFDAFLAMIEPYELDYLILGQHFLQNEIEGMYSAQLTSDPEHIKAFASQIIEGMRTGKFTFVAHPDVMPFRGDPEVYRREVSRICEASLELDIPLEINMLGLRDKRNYPTPEFWRVVAEYGCRVVAGCDAHSPDAVAEPGNIRETFEFAESMGITIDDSPLLLRKPT
ncbi:MAG: histidinol-phosphatase [Eubacteriales bacterium]|jgi:histidinol-phosphatase (PHP family)|nr:histidinol-phosphatase [Clostridiales bacterium]